MCSIENLSTWLFLGYTNAEEQFLLDKTSKAYKLGDGPKWTLAGRNSPTDNKVHPGNDNH